MFERSVVRGALMLAAGSPLAAQSLAQYRAQTESLARIWKALPANPHVDLGRGPSGLPADSQRVGNYVVRADTPFVALGKAVVERLQERATRAYGEHAALLQHFQFVIRRQEGSHADLVRTSVVDSAGSNVLQSSDYANESALESSWASKTENLLAESLGRAFLDFAGGTIPMTPPDKKTWLDGRTELLLAGSNAARRCVAGDDRMCRMMLGVDAISDPAFEFFDAKERYHIVMTAGRSLRRANPERFDRCAETKLQLVCDSLAAEIPPDAYPYPAPGNVRRSFVRYALMMGGDGAFDRLASATTPRARIESAARVPVDSVVHAWRRQLLDSKTASTAMDGATAASALFWAGLCACLALRSSRWR